VILTHASTEMLTLVNVIQYEMAHDGMVIEV
jgi:hypothetical protein